VYCVVAAVGNAPFLISPGASESCIDMYKPGMRCLELAAAVHRMRAEMHSHADSSWACGTLETTWRLYRQQRFYFEQLTPHKDDLCSRTALAVGLNKKCRQWEPQVDINQCPQRACCWRGARCGIQDSTSRFITSTLWTVPECPQ
jgi:hypothetical protein